MEVNWGVIGGSRGVVAFCVGVVGRGGLVDVVVGDPSGGSECGGWV